MKQAISKTIAVIALIAIIGYGYFKKATMEVRKPSSVINAKK